MKRQSYLVSLLVLSCVISFQAAPSARAEPNLVIQTPGQATQKIDFGRHFRELGVEGSILIYDANNIKSG